MLHNKSLAFAFPDYTSAVLAWGMYKELGYTAQREANGQVRIHLTGGDLVSALEIAMAYGGRLREEASSPATAQLIDSAYGWEEGIVIPAHIVNEDWIMAEEALEQEGRQSEQ